MWTSLQGVFNLGTGPWRSGKLDWSATVFIMAEQALRRVLYIVERCEIATSTTASNKLFPTSTTQQFNIPSNVLT
jgi:transposase